MKDWQAAVTIVVVLIIAFGSLYYLTGPPADQREAELEEEENPTYKASLKVRVESAHILVGKDYELKFDDVTKKTFHLKAFQALEMVFPVTWQGDEMKTIKVTVESTGAEGIGDMTDGTLVTLTDGSIKEITLKA